MSRHGEDRRFDLVTACMALQDVADVAAGLRNAFAVLRAGGRMIFCYLTMGQYDFVSVVELPDAQAAATILLGLGSQGNVQTTTLTAFTEDETAQIIAGLN